MSQLQELERLPISPGVHLRLFIDHAFPINSPQHRYTETHYDGQPGSQAFATPLHWHKFHAELISVTRGQAEVEVEGKVTLLSQGDPEVRIPAWQTHAIRCFAGVPAVVREATDPCGDFKEKFFRDFFGDGSSLSFWYVMRAFWDGDVYGSLDLPVIGRSKLVDQMFFTFFGAIAKLVAPGRKPHMEPPEWNADDVGKVQVAIAANA